MSAFLFLKEENTEDTWDDAIAKFRGLLEELAAEGEVEKIKGLPEAN